MDKPTLYTLNDLVDVADMLAVIVNELNPGAANQIGFIEFLLKRVRRNLDDVRTELGGRLA